MAKLIVIICLVTIALMLVGSLAGDIGQWLVNALFGSLNNSGSVIFSLYI